MRTLAIDWGAKRCGLAWSDALGISTTPLAVVAPADLLPTLQRLVTEGPVATLVLGYPTRLDGTATHSTQAVETLYTQLQAAFPHVEVVLWDERLTSQQASRLLVQGGTPKHKRREKGTLDLAAAVLLLQEYLRSRER